MAAFSGSAESRPPPPGESTPAEEWPAPGELLRRAVIGLRRGTLGFDDAQRLADCFERYLRDPRHIGLDDAFGVKIGDGGEHWLITEARHRQAWLLAEYRRRFGVSVATLAAAVRDYRRHWPHDRRLPAMPEAYRSRPREVLFLAFQESTVIGKDVPTSVRQLHRLLALGSAINPPMFMSVGSMLPSPCKSEIDDAVSREDWKDWKTAQRRRHGRQHQEGDRRD